MKNLSIILSVLMFVSFVVISCDNETETEEVIDIDTTIQAEVSIPDEYIEFISLPSPIETSLILQKAGAAYDESLLNATENYEKYSTSFVKALNLGVFSADMCFSSMFNQSQTSIKYLSTTKKLSEDLGVMDAIDNSIFERMEKYANEKDSLMFVLSDIIMNADMFLKESDRAETAATILAGGWIEGLYIASQLITDIEANKDITKIIMDQRLSLESLLLLMAKYKDNTDLQPLITKLESVKVIFDKVEVTDSKIEVVTDTETNTSVIKSNSVSTMSPEVFAELTEAVIKLRTSVIEANI